MIAVRVGEQVLLRQEVADLLGDHRRAALPAADIDGKAQFALARCFFRCRPMSCTWIAARSRSAPVTAILNLRGR